MKNHLKQLLSSIEVTPIFKQISLFRIQSFYVFSFVHLNNLIAATVILPGV